IFCIGLALTRLLLLTPFLVAFHKPRGGPVEHAPSGFGSLSCNLLPIEFILRHTSGGLVSRSAGGSMERAKIQRDQFFALREDRPKFVELTACIFLTSQEQFDTPDLQDQRFVHLSNN